MLKGKQLHDFTFVQSLEWIETNGLGGYASSTVSGAHSRRYHGLLVAALTPPLGRTVVLSKLDETVITGGDRVELGSNQYPGTVHPQGFRSLTSFHRELFPEFIYQAGDVRIRKTISALQGENTTIILYEVMDAEKEFHMEFLPLCSVRDFHGLSHANPDINTKFTFANGVFHTRNYPGGADLFISIPDSQFEAAQHWYHHFEYLREQERGLDYREDLFSHGKFTVRLSKADKLGIIVSASDPMGRDAISLYNLERSRREASVKKYSWNDDIRRLVLAADQFIVKRGEHSKTIIAGYHWFGDWGRDTMIALPGLCMVTGKFDEARMILLEFASFISEGMLPNRFPELGEAPEYNTVDATLWFFYAIYKYYGYTGDQAFVRQFIPILDDIVDWHDKGTRYNIHTDSDGLLFAGQEGVQLTWMDAKVGDWVVTPREGKAVEINALWYNALSILEVLHSEVGSSKKAKGYEERALKIRARFNQLFWNDSKGYLYDYVNAEYKNDDLRPNQIYALSLPFQLLSKERAEKVFGAVTRHLLTPRGLRSLTPDHKDYQPIYQGDQRSRDGAYHQGTVWSFLLGPYIDALMHLKGEKGRVESRKILENFFGHLNEAGIGTVSEIFDGQKPHTPRGCIAQAWGVGEILRAALEYDLFPNPKEAVKPAKL